MIVVHVVLHSARNGRKTELARMVIANTGEGSDAKADYIATTARGRGSEQLNKMTPQRFGAVRKWPRHRKHVWALVGECLAKLGYVQGRE